MVNQMQQELEEREEIIKTILEISDGDWDLVKLTRKKIIKHYIGQVLAKDFDASYNEVKVKFLFFTSLWLIM